MVHVYRCLQLAVKKRIPFTIWSGKIATKRGLFWGSLQFFLHT
ncbi:hypothetical protein O9992_26745 [Vibrio lentus]|nr:hypothetical protein [Vibrio lentus]